MKKSINKATQVNNGGIVNYDTFLSEVVELFEFASRASAHGILEGQGMEAGR